MNNAVTSSATATRFAPHRLNPLRKPPERSSPSAPPLQLALRLGLRSRVTPIEKAVPGDEGESESCLHPELRSAYGERGGEINGGGGIDKLRMKITDSNGGLVYDNLLNAPDSSDPSTVLGGGDIIIHKS